METIISKLSVETTDLKHEYLINNVVVGLQRAIKNRQIKQNNELYNRLLLLYNEVKEFPCYFRRVDLKDQLRAQRIGLEALELIKEEFDLSL